MNLEQVKSIVRDVLQIVGTLLVAYKVFGMTDGLWEGIAGGILMVVPVIWGMFAHTEVNAIQIAAAIPAVKKVVLEPSREGIAIRDAIKSTPSATVTIAP